MPESLMLTSIPFTELQAQVIFWVAIHALADAEIFDKAVEELPVTDEFMIRLRERLHEHAHKTLEEMVRDDDSDQT